MPFKFAKHVAYFRRCVLQPLPTQYTSLDTNQPTLTFFALSALDLLQTDIDDQELALNTITWLYSLQVDEGFRGALFYENDDQSPPNLAMTYTSLLSLVILGDDLSRVNRTSIVAGLRQLQQPGGCFVPFPGSIEADMRFLYCACAVSYILNDWSGVDKDRAVQYITESTSHDFGFGQGPGQESHGGSTYCAVASLALMGRLNDLKSRDGTIRWCLMRQTSGFQGRVNKPVDTCYAFWIGATLNILESLHLVDKEALMGFLESTQSKYGGFGKEQDDPPDILHSYMGLAGLALLELIPELSPINAALNLSSKKLAHLQSMYE